MSDLSGSQLWREIDREDVDLPRCVAVHLQIALYRFLYLVELFPIDSFLWGAEGYARPTLHLAEVHDTLSDRDDVDLAKSRVPVLFDDAIASRLQKAFGNFFAGSSTLFSLLVADGYHTFIYLLAY